MATVALVAAVAIGLRGDEAGTTAAGAPTPTPSVTAAPTGAPEPTSSPDLPPQAPVRVEVPRLGLDTSVLPITPTGGEVDPPTFQEAYWIEPYGHPGSDNTTYIAGHSATRGSAIFDALFDRVEQKALVTTGDEVVVTTSEGRYTYLVTGTERYRKGRLATADEVWAKVPGRLALITCFQRPNGGLSQDNLVVYAQLVEGPEGAQGLPEAAGAQG